MRSCVFFTTNDVTLRNLNLFNKHVINIPYLLTYLFTYLLIYLHTYLLTYLLTPCSRVLLEKLIGFAASQEIPRIYGTRKYITVLTSARHLSLS
jgi:hypothetical protein